MDLRFRLDLHLGKDHRRFSLEGKVGLPGNIKQGTDEPDSVSLDLRLFMGAQRNDHTGICSKGNNQSSVYSLFGISHKLGDIKAILVPVVIWTG